MDVMVLGDGNVEVMVLGATGHGHHHPFVVAA